MSNDFNPYAQHGQQYPAPGPNYGPPPPPRGGSRLWAYIIAGVVLAGGVLVVACCGGLFVAGKSVMEQEILYALRDNPTIREHIGEIQDVTYNLSATIAHDDDDADVFDIVGTKGSGEVTAYTDEDLGFISGTLRLSNGESYELP